MDPSLHPVSSVLEQADDRLRAGPMARSRVWPTGFPLLDHHLGGGFRTGDLVLLAGPQGLGKTMWALQMARNVARDERAVLYCSYEHDPETMLIRLLALEAGLRHGVDAPDMTRFRTALEDSDGFTGALADRLQFTDGGAEALRAVQEYAGRLVLQRATGSSTTLDVIRASVEQVTDRTGQKPMVIVDYLQKVKVPDRPTRDDDRITIVVEGLKDLALDLDVPVVAITAADKAGITSGKRMRISNLRGSTALAYEADTVVIFNSKFDVVARHHLVYDLNNAERFRDWVVVTIEKNRGGKDGIDLEFQKHFSQARFETDGRLVSEQLVDERVFVE